LIESQDQAVRKRAWEAYADAHLSVQHALAEAVVGAIKRDIFFARARDYASSLDMDLDTDNIPRAVFDNLLTTFQRRLPTWHRYFEIRRRALGLEQLHAYDVHVPLVRTVRAIPYHEAIEIISRAMQPLGDSYTVPLRRGLVEQRWVDVYPNQGKGSGAFSTGVYGTHPFLMLNYDNTLATVSILAHELGHSMHSYFAWQHQSPIYAQYPMFAGETASNLNQALLRAHLLTSSADQELQLEVLADAMANLLRYLFIMPTLARFTLDCHTRVEHGKGVTAESMSGRLVELFREAFGPGVVLDEPRVGITWAQFPPLFNNFYVFTYATGISAANALAEGIVREGQPAAERYLDFLKAGGSVYALDALRVAGIDMGSSEPVERAFDVLEGLIDRLDQLVGPGPLQP
jgi:oligoendopeptidase F